MKKRVGRKARALKKKKDIPKEIVMALLIIVIIVYIIGTWVMVDSFNQMTGGRPTTEPAEETASTGRTTDVGYADVKITILEKPDEK